MINKKILIINKSLVIGGIETVVDTQYESLILDGHNIDILLFKYDTDSLSHGNRNIFYVDKFGSIKLFMQEQEEKIKYDLIICHAQSERICKKVKALNRKNIIFVLHGMHSDKLKNGNIIARFLRKKRTQFLYNNQNIVAVSDSVKKDIESIGVKAKNMKVVYNPFNVNNIQTLANEKIDKVFERPYLLWVGRISEIKNLPLLIEIYKNIAMTYDLVIIGDGSEDILAEVKMQIIEEKLVDKVHFLGFKKNPYPFMKHASALILTSKNEGLPMVIVESLVLNTPAFSVDIPATMELLSKYYPSGILALDKSYMMSEKIIDNITNTIDVDKIIEELSFRVSNAKYLNYFVE